jgi:uncharacterized protein
LWVLRRDAKRSGKLAASCWHRYGLFRGARTQRTQAWPLVEEREQNLPKSCGLYAADGNCHKVAATMNTPPGPLEAVLDTNVVLDWLVFADVAGRRVGDAVVSGALQWLATPRILQEWRSVLARPLATRWEHARQRAQAVDVSAHCRMCAEAAPAAAGQLICRDPDDQVFIDLALAHRPSLLLTRDRALLALRRRARACGVTVMTPAMWVRAGPA